MWIYLFFYCSSSGKILFRRSHIRDVAMKRLRPINEYCRVSAERQFFSSTSSHVAH